MSGTIDRPAERVAERRTHYLHPGAEAQSVTESNLREQGFEYACGTTRDGHVTVVAGKTYTDGETALDTSLVYFRQANGVELRSAVSVVDGADITVAPETVPEADWIAVIDFANNLKEES
jgi:hypothetical protein